MKPTDTHTSSQDLAGRLVVGCRYSGKSHRYVAARRALGSAALATDAAAWAQQADPGAVIRLVDREIEAALAHLRQMAGQPWWVLDNAELLFAHASSAALDRLLEATQAGRLRLLLVRNRYVLEEDGMLARREAALASQLIREDLAPLSLDEAERVAARLYGQDVDGRQKARWLAVWSGGVPGWMYLLKPLAPPFPTEGEPPRDLPLHVQHTVRAFALDTPERRRVGGALRCGALPSRALLDAGGRQALGYLEAIGAIDGGGTPRSPYWAAVLDNIGAEPAPALDDSTDLNLHVALLVESAGLTGALADSLGCAREATAIALGLDAALRWSHQESSSTAVLARILAAHLGTHGLLSLLRAAGQPQQGGGPPELLARVLLSRFRVAR